MTIQQWVYTSSCWRMKPGSGYGTFSVSTGLGEADITELEQWCGRYSQPRDLPMQPDATELARDFPVVLNSFALSSGMRVLSRCQYLGKGWHDPRWGNFIVHALVSNEDWPNYAISYFDSPVFWRDIPDDLKARALRVKSGEGHWEAPPKLQELDGSDLVASGNYDPDGLANLRQRTPGLDDQAALLLDKIVASPASRLLFRVRPITVAPDVLAAAFFQLPRKMANLFTFSTYQPPARSAAPTPFALTAVAEPPADFDLTSSEQKVTTDPSVQSPLVLANRTDRRALHHFAESCGELTLSDISTVAELFLFLRQTGPVPNTTAMMSLLTFAFERGPVGCRAEALVQFEHHADTVSEEIFVALCKLVYTASDSEAHRQAGAVAEDVFRKIICRLCSQSPDSAIRCFQKWLDVVGTNVALAWLAADHLKQLASQGTEKMHGAEARALLSVTFLSLAKNATEPASLEATCLDTLQNLVRVTVADIEQWRILLDMAGGLGPAFLANAWIWQIQATKDTSHAGEAMASQLARMKFATANEVRTRLAVREAFDPLYAEFERQMVAAQAKAWDFFIDYAAAMFGKNSAYAQKCFARALTKALQGKTGLVPKDVEWILSHFELLANEADRKNTLRRMSELLPASPPDAQWISVLEKMCQVYDKTFPDENKSYLGRCLLWGADVAKDKKPTPADMIRDMEYYAPITTSLDTPRRKELRRWLLPVLYDAASNAKTQETMLWSFYVQREERELARIFVEQAGRHAAKNQDGVKSAHVLATIECVLAKFDATQTMIVPLLEEMADALFKRFTPGDLANFEASTGDLIKSGGDESGKRWLFLRKRIFESRYAEFENQMVNQESPWNFFVSYTEATFKKSKAYARQYFGQTLVKILQKKTSVVPKDVDWILRHLDLLTDETERKGVLHRLLDMLPTSHPDDLWLPVLEALCLEHQKTPSDGKRPHLAQCLFWGAGVTKRKSSTSTAPQTPAKTAAPGQAAGPTEPASDNLMREIEYYTPIISALDSSRRNELRKWLLPILYDAAPNAETLGKVLQGFHVQGDEQELATLFVAQVKRHVGKNKPDATHGYVVNTIECFLEKVREGKLVDRLRDELAGVLFKGFTTEELDDFEATTGNLTKSGNVQGKARWQSLRSQVEKNSQGGVVKRVFTGIGRLFKKK